MMYPLIIVIAIPIFLGVVIVSPFEPQELEDEQIQETPVEETPDTTRNIIFILLGIIWLFFFFRLLRVLFTGRYRYRLKKR